MKLKWIDLKKLLESPERMPKGIRVCKSRGALTLRWGHWRRAPYDIPLEHLKTERGILCWTLHLAEKGWPTAEQLADFMRAACRVGGVELFSK